MTESAPRGGPQLSRRTLLAMLGGSGAAVLLGGCGGHSEPNQSGASSPGDFPTGDVTFRWVDSGDQKATYLEQYFERYSQEHPNITIQYDPLPRDEIAQVVPLGVQNGNAHDVFQLPPGVTGAQAIRENWVAPLNDIVPDFETWKSRFPEGHFLQGSHEVDGKLYGFRLGSGRRYGTMLLYNRQYLDAAGYDPESEPLTWETFRDAARRVTQAGGGDYYGYVIGGGQVERWAYVVSGLAEMAGSGTGTWQVVPFDWTTGEFVFTTDQHIGAIELLLAMKADGSIFPDSAGITAPQAREMVPQGVAAMILQGPWNIPIWQDTYPDFDFGVASQPVPDGGSPTPMQINNDDGNTLWVFAGSEYQRVAGDMFAYLGSEEGQREWARIVGVSDPPALSSAMDDAELDERSQRAWDLFGEQLRVGPEPVVRNIGAADVLTQWGQGLTPTFGETLQGIFTGQLDDPRQALQEAQDRYNAELDRAIEAASSAAAEVSRDDFVFSNWDPTRDYTTDDYAQL
ncbi:ABC transporter substrate-binding protein [Jiangella asiatica]|uniref:Carbohydrate ABC transporter substrate-binding protein n=1 Tax=Jiangella asiatica TaxID=2530372 RepID=A0A4R5CK70_9ACTN|nr:ABC transporter substrate-binding protein [Jiangella asiatica]TDE00256.1 carbohydrate ABC transporter substrate-binding protein [Jiangella asiatica]